MIINICMGVVFIILGLCSYLLGFGSNDVYMMCNGNFCLIIGFVNMILYGLDKNYQKKE